MEIGLHCAITFFDTNVNSMVIRATMKRVKVFFIGDFFINN